MKTAVYFSVFTIALVIFAKFVSLIDSKFSPSLFILAFIVMVFLDNKFKFSPVHKKGCRSKGSEPFKNFIGW